MVCLESGLRSHSGLRVFSNSQRCSSIRGADLFPIDVDRDTYRHLAMEKVHNEVLGSCRAGFGGGGGCCLAVFWSGGLELVFHVSWEPLKSLTLENSKPY